MCDNIKCDQDKTDKYYGPYFQLPRVHYNWSQVLQEWYYVIMVKYIQDETTNMNHSNM